ncbi:MAG TPA: cyclic 2,3-diphosphoglycerate synthase [Verrucomicrobiae bacterium]|jgi:predicted GTPase|nr:cyclic 2,3-diphosphoglycerate synthase [Verrucomicrobiae bacterium]
MKVKKILILGAAGRDFHNFNIVFRGSGDYQVVGFTATQIPGIANRRYPPALAGPLYPAGIPIFEEKDLEHLIAEHEIEVVVFSYSDISHQNLMHLASRVIAAGSDFWLLGAEHTQLKSSVPVVSVCAVRTGCGKSPIARLVTSELRREGWKPVVIRHPMPYGDLEVQAVQRFATIADLDRQQCTIEEREEYEPHLREGTVVYAGVDYGRILRQAEQEADIILWDGGNNDTSFYASDLEIVVVDPHRPGHELSYYPGEVNLRRADVIVINKVDTAAAQDVETVRKNVHAANPKARVVETACRVAVSEPEIVKGRSVLVVEDGPTLTHGEMPYGAGVVAARQSGASELVDPRPYAVGSIRGTYENYRHLTSLLPAMGYSAIQCHELEETINRVPCDLVLVATPIDLGHLIKLNKPSLRVTYEVEDLSHPGLTEILARFTRERSGVPA